MIAYYSSMCSNTKSIRRDDPRFSLVRCLLYCSFFLSFRPPGRCAAFLPIPPSPSPSIQSLCRLPTSFFAKREIMTSAMRNERNLPSSFFIRSFDAMTFYNYFAHVRVLLSAFQRAATCATTTTTHVNGVEQRKIVIVAVAWRLGS